MTVKGCTFYNNGFIDGSTSNRRGGAIYTIGNGRLTLIGNLFYGNTAGDASSGHVIFRDSGIVESLGYNIVDVEVGADNSQSGFAAAIGDTKINEMPISFKSFRLFHNSVAAGIIPVMPANYPTFDFYGNPITAPAAAGAVQETVSGTGYYLEVFPNDPAKGSFNVLTTVDADGIVPSGTSVTITAEPIELYEFAYWLVNGQKAGSNSTINFTITEHTFVQALFAYIVNDFADTDTLGTLRHALDNAQDNDVIRFANVTPGTSVVELTGALPQIIRSISIEGNGITITRSPSWTVGTWDSSAFSIGPDTEVTINRIHFKDNSALYGGVIVNGGKLTLESCIFSGNRGNGNQVSIGGAINNYGTMTVKGCTFYNNGFSGSAAGTGRGGAIYTRDQSRLLLIGNLFYGNRAGDANLGHLIFNDGGIVESLGYNIVDVDLGTANNQSGFAAAIGDIKIDELPVSTTSFRHFPNSEALGVITAIPADYPIYDFYGNQIIAPATVGAVQGLVSGTGYLLEVAANTALRGSYSISAASNADGLISSGSTVSITASPADNFAVSWFVNGQNAGTENTFNFNITENTKVQVLFAYIVNDFADTGTPGTFRHAMDGMQDNDIIRFVNVTPGTSVVELTSSLPEITRSITIEGNGITITRSPSWAEISWNTSLLSTSYGSAAHISRVHFKDGRASSAAAIWNNGCYMILESCIFSGNRSIAEGGIQGGTISTANRGILILNGCTFYDNIPTSSATVMGGVIYIGHNASSLIMSGNIFFGNTTEYPIVYLYIDNDPNPFRGPSSVISLGYNVVDVDLGEGEDQSGWIAHNSDKTFAELLGSNTTSPFVNAAGGNLTPVSGLNNFIPTAPANFPIVDFYGNTRIWPGAPGAVR